MSSAEAAVALLDRPDGSGSYKWNGYEVLAAANGPVEAQRRDEIADEAAIEVIVRPASGVASIRERHFESIIHRVLRQVIRTESHPRTLFQVVLQVTTSPATESASGRLPQAVSSLPLLAVLLNAAMVAVLSARIPLHTAYAAIFLAIDNDKIIIPDATPKQISNARSIHAMCLSSRGEILLAESEGRFEYKEWLSVAEQAKSFLLSKIGTDDMEVGHMDVDEPSISGMQLIRKLITDEVSEHEAWRLEGS